MQILFDTQKIILDQFKTRFFYHRAIFDRISSANAITGVLGCRGVGKTSYLLHRVLQANAALYVSADNPFFLKNSLLEVADYLYKETEITLLCIDEIHKYPQWQQALKNISDIYRQIKIIFTGSSMIDIIHSQYDLSRRVTLHHLGGFSFREYLEFYHEQKLPILSLDMLVTEHQTFAAELQTPKILFHFRTYLQKGYYPFACEFAHDYDLFQAIENIIQKTIYEDIAVLHNVHSASLLAMEQTYKYILNSDPGELNVNKLANLLAKSYDQVSEYLMWLEQAGIIQCVYSNKKGKAFIKTPRKLLPENTNLMYSAYLPLQQSDMTGKIREAFFINQLKHAKEKIFYADAGDYQTQQFVFEIGGKNKTRQQIQHISNAFIVADSILVGAKSTIPLYVFGFLY